MRQTRPQEKIEASNLGRQRVRTDGGGGFLGGHAHFFVATIAADGERPSGNKLGERPSGNKLGERPSGNKLLVTLLS
jgi:hypothetical protein